MHNALRVAVVERFQDLKHVVADIEIVEALVKFSEISIASINELSDNGRRLRKWVAHNIDQLNDVDSVLEGLQDLDLTSDLVLLHYREAKS